MHAFDVLGDPVRRRILELLADGERSAGEVTAAVREEFGISQPAVSQHLKVLRDNGFTRVRAEGARRLYAVDPEPLREVDGWLAHFRGFWEPHLDALATELARGRRERRSQQRQAGQRIDEEDRRGPDGGGDAGEAGGVRQAGRRDQCGLGGCHRRPEGVETGT